jgi:glycosyltransferase involved in cell wall biosynthesis
MDRQQVLRETEREARRDTDQTTRLEASIVLCTNNPRMDYLSRVIDALRAQTVSLRHWELIIVDNASIEPLAKTLDLSWHPLARHVNEPKLGVASARQRGIAEARAPLIVFVDDDNVLAANYIETALEIATNCGFLSAWGSGSISPEFEIEPAQQIVPLIPFLAIRKADRSVWCNSISFTDATPVGAGLCLRRDVGAAYLEFAHTSTIEIGSLKGDSLEGHEDYEICYLACRDGGGMGVFPELKIVHLIPRERVTERYIKKLVESRTYSHFVLLYKWKGWLPGSPFSVHGLASFCMNLFTRRGFDRHIYFAELRAVIAARRRFARGRRDPLTS